jgi:DNA ligase D-like protein (predicted ligase)
MAAFKNALKGIKKSAAPRWRHPMLATLTERYFSDPAWIYEEKFDGMRCLALKKRGKVTLYSRSGRIVNNAFPELVQTLEDKASKDYLADGEIITFDKRGVSNFALLQNRMNVRDVRLIKGKAAKVYYYLFDLPYWDQYDIRGLPLLLRKQLLKNFFPFAKQVRYTKHIKKNGLLFYKKAKKKGWEGIIAKKSGSHYLSKRSRDWLKFKCSRGQELVIGGYTSPQGARKGFGALLVGYYDAKNRLHYAGKVGTGYSVETLHLIEKKLARLKTERCPFAMVPKEKKAHWVRPQLVGEVEFTEWTKDNKLRHPRFKGLRTDKSAKSITRE